jgi:hypothetical protein
MYIVIEIQNNNGKVTATPLAYENYNQALNKYYDILRYACVTSLKVHSACILDETGSALMNESFGNK